MKAVKDRLLELVKNIIASGMYEKHDIKINRKVIMINLLSIIGIINLISLGIVALVRDNNTLGAFALFVAGILIINLLYLRWKSYFCLLFWDHLCCCAILLPFYYRRPKRHRASLVLYFSIICCICSGIQAGCSCNFGIVFCCYFVFGH